MSEALFQQIKPLSNNPTPAELASFSRAVRGALSVLQSVPGQLATLDKQVAESVASSAALVAGGDGTDIEVVEAPTAAMDLEVFGSFAKNILQWAAATYQGHAYTEIWRAQVDDLGQAVEIDGEQFRLWADENLPKTSLAETYFYWIRHVNKNGDAGAYNAVAGTPGRTADDPEYLLQLAAEKWQASYDYAAGDLAMPTAPNGYCYEVTVDGGSSGETEPTWPTVIDEEVVDGDLTWKCTATFSFEAFFKLALVGGVPKLTLKELFLADGIIKKVMIGDAEIDDAKVANLSAAKLLAGIISAADIYLGNSSRVHLDGANERIVVKDANGTTRVIVGNLGTGWGIEIYDAAGQTILNSGGVPLAMVAGAGAFAGVDQITSVNIGTYLETAAILEAYIANAAVGTLKIGPDAVILPSGASLASPYATTIDNSWYNIGVQVSVLVSADVVANGPVTLAVFPRMVASHSNDEEYSQARILCNNGQITGLIGKTHYFEVLNNDVDNWRDIHVDTPLTGVGLVTIATAGTYIIKAQGFIKDCRSSAPVTWAAGSTIATMLLKR